MKKTVSLVLLALVWTVSVSLAAELKVGDKAPDFKLKDSTGKEYFLDHPQFKGKVLYIAYVDPDEKDTNNHVEDALKKEKDSGGLDKTRYEGFGIVNLKASMMPNFLIKSAIKSKQEKTGAIIILNLITPSSISGASRMTPPTWWSSTRSGSAGISTTANCRRKSWRR